MARRALLTDRERELIADPEAGDARYVAVSRVRRKIEEELTEDVQLLRHHHPDLYEELQAVVCGEEAAPPPQVESSDVSSSRPPREYVADLDLPGSGETLESRRDAVNRLYKHLQEEGTATRADFLELVDPDEVGYSSAESFWTNLVKARDALKQLPGVEAPGKGEHTWRYSAETWP